jgi:two-component system chemotaxis response regulator CheB
MKSMPADCPPILITQHLPAAFSDSFVQHIDAVTQMKASIPVDGQIIEWGNIYLAPGGLQMGVKRVNNQYVIRIEDSEPVNRHKPAVDVLFHAAAKCAGENAVCVLLTGMGADGAVGMKALKEAGAKTIVQDEATSVVWGMPGAAYKLGCADYVLPLDDIAAKILTLVKTLR